VEKSPETKGVFEKVKEIMSNPPVLALFRKELQQIVECDASYGTLGACLKQSDSQGQESIIAFASRTLSGPETRYCTTRNELLAILFALKRWRHYLLGRPISVRTNHYALRYLFTSCTLSDF
jgi:hypothetical protein